MKQDKYISTFYVPLIQICTTYSVRNTKSIPTSYRWATGERISLKALHAATDRSVVLGDALRINSATSNTGISAFVGHTSQMWWTVLVDDAFWTTVWRCSKHSRQTRTDPMFIINQTTIWIWTTRWRDAWMIWNHSFAFYKKEKQKLVNQKQEIFKLVLYQ